MSKISEAIKSLVPDIIESKKFAQHAGVDS